MSKFIEIPLFMSTVNHFWEVKEGTLKDIINNLLINNMELIDNVYHYLYQEKKSYVIKK